MATASREAPAQPLASCRQACLLLLGAWLAVSQAQAPAQETPAAYLFAHMTKQDYGRLYYALSTDGRHWQPLNGGRRIQHDYRGHPDITRGHDGRYYLIGNYERRPDINLWVSDDLAAWKPFGSFQPDLSQIPDFPNAIPYIGAPKIMYDEPTSQYVITWHTPDVEGDPVDTEKFWRHMRTLYVTSADLKSFSRPGRLFDWDIATIDVILRREGAQCFALVKDERYPSFDWPTGKTIRVAVADQILGPYRDLSDPITPNFREAPAVIPRPDGKGWYLYAEQYPAVSYTLATAPRLGGPWHDVYWQDFKIPPDARHGCMIPLSSAQYRTLVEAMGAETPQASPP